MDSTSSSRYGPAVLAVIAFVVTFAAVLFYGLSDRVDPAQGVVEPLEREGGEVPYRLEDLAATVVALGLEVALAREDAALAREDAAAAREEAAALTVRLVETERRNEEMAARQEDLEAALAAARQPPRVTLRVPEEPEVVVQTAEPEVTVEPAGSDPAATARRASVERRSPGSAGARGPAAGDLVGSDVVNSRGEAIGRIAEIVRERGGNRLYFVLDLGGVRGDAAAGETKRVAVARDAFDLGPNDELVLPRTVERELAAMPAYREGDFERLSR